MFAYNLFDNTIKLKLVLSNYAILLLHTPIKIDPDYLWPMWQRAGYRVCVDEASMTLHTYAEANNLSMIGMYPHLLSGDFRSLPDQLLKTYEEHGAEVVPTVDDDLTDFTKSLYEIAKRNDKVDSAIAVVEPTGRLDQMFANLNTLTMGRRIFGRDFTIYLLSKTSISWILQPGVNTIHRPEWIKKYPCGILPFAPTTSNVTTTGLQWNLSGQSIQFDGLMSTSNKFTDEPRIIVQTDVPLIWTMTIDTEDIYSNPCKAKSGSPPVSHEPQPQGT